MREKRATRYNSRMFKAGLRVFFLSLLSLIAVCALSPLLPLCAAEGITVNNEAVWSGDRSVTAKVVRIPLASYRVRIGLANGRVGSTQSLAGIAENYNAIVAINGCFFNAYTKDAVKPPYHNIITDGRVVHLGSTGTTLGFDADNNYRMEHPKILIEGSQTGSNVPEYPNWYAFLINHPAESSNVAMMFDALWAGGTTPDKGTQAVVDSTGMITAVSAGSKQIPDGGYVLLFAGGEEYLAGRLRAGNYCNFALTYQNCDTAFWSSVEEAIGCGPRLVAGGEVSYNPESEGFTSEKILVNSGARSAIGITSDGTLLLVTCTATVRELAGMMQALKAYDAMNLDGGASSGLWKEGSYLVKPGRDISNAVVIVRR